MSYQIADEPTERGRQSFVVRPSVPLFAMMFCGAWLAFPWFAANAIALDSPTSRREVKLAATAMAGVVALVLAIYTLVDLGVIESRLALRIALLVVSGVKVGFAYWLSIVQNRTFNVYTYYGGTVQKAFYVVMAGRYARPIIFGLSASPIWHAIIS
jgi:hypothetical protein